MLNRIALLVSLFSVTVSIAAEPQAINRAAAVGLQFAADTTVIEGPRTSDGLPDYVAALNEKLASGVSAAENFWVLMWPAIGNAERTRMEYIHDVEGRLGITISPQPRYQEADLKYGTPEGERLSEQQSEAMTRPWTRQEFPAIARWVDANAAMLDEVHAAAQRPKAFAPLISSMDGSPGLMVGILLPHVQALRNAARVLSARAMLRLSEGDVEGSWRDLTDILRIAAHSERGPTLIEALVGYALRSVAAQPMAHWIARCGLSAEELELRLAALQPLLKTPSLAHAIDCERYMYLDVVVSLLSGRMTSRETMGLLDPVVITSGDDGSGEAMSQLQSAREMAMQFLLLGSDVNETLRYGNRMYDDLVAAMQPPTHLERQALLNVIDDRVKQDAAVTRDTGAFVKAYLFSSRQEVKLLPAKVLTGLLMPAITAVENARARVDGYSAMLNAAFMVQIHFVRRQELPADLSAAMGERGADIVDPFSGEAVKLTIDQRGLVLYSIGPNGKDDGGRFHNEGENCDDPRILLPIAP